MINLQTIYNESGSSKLVHNFYRSSYYLETKAYLEAQGLKPQEIISRVHAMRNQPSEVRGHLLIAMAMLQWANAPKYLAQLTKLIESNKNKGQA